MIDTFNLFDIIEHHVSVNLFLENAANLIRKTPKGICKRKCKKLKIFIVQLTEVHSNIVQHGIFMHSKGERTFFLH